MTTATDLRAVPDVSLTQHEEYRVEYEKLDTLQLELNAVRAEQASWMSRSGAKKASAPPAADQRAAHRRGRIQRFLLGDRAAIDEPEPEFEADPSPFDVLSRREAFLKEAIGEQREVVRRLRAPASEQVCAALEDEYHARARRLAAALIEASEATAAWEALIDALEREQASWAHHLPGPGHLRDRELTTATAQSGAQSAVRSWLAQAVEAELVRRQDVPVEILEGRAR